MSALNRPVVIVDYDERWPERFEGLRKRVAAELGVLVVTIEHIGSTSVPGLAAKPIIDLNVVVASRKDVSSALDGLAGLGYEHQGDGGLAGREAFKPPPNLPPHHLYLVTQDNEHRARHLAFRDYLRAHPETAAAYAKLKRRLAARYRHDREAYTEAKTVFVEAVLDKAGKAQG